MKPPLFSYVAPNDLDEALAVLAEYGDDVSVLSGGQSLMPLLNMRLARPEVLLDINGIQDLDYVRRDHTGFNIGALTRFRRLEKNRELNDRLPVVQEALSHVGHPQIRNRTTIGGNVAHADPSSEMPSLLAALEGTVVLTSSRGSRVVKWDEFFVSVFLTCKEPDELVTEVRLPTEDEWTFQFAEFSRRRGDFPLVAITVGTKMHGAELSGLRVSVTGVGERVVRLGETEALGAGFLDDSLINTLAKKARNETVATADDSGSADYRRSLVGTLLRRSLSHLISRDAAHRYQHSRGVLK